jgi:hypothetical protein
MLLVHTRSLCFQEDLGDGFGFLGDGFLFLRGAPKQRRGGLVKRVFSVQWGDRAKSEEEMA